MWKDYIDFIERKEHQKVTAVNFRDKSFGWASHKESFKLSDTYTYTYTYTFYQHIMFRHSCGICHYTNLRRTGDITLADYWGFEKTDPSINSDDLGVSLILVNTPKGNQYYSAITDKIRSIPTTKDKCMQPNLSHPSIIHPGRNDFEEDYDRFGFEYTMKKYALMGWKYYFNQFMTEMKGKIWRLRKRFKS